ncbi:metalloregulator ArsR/SmtB family transcription factor [Vibrio tapetis subsp. quintayensis]|uniref:ArsR/SmtB family transcription factor n=1 Tax=Vibrio tapetis TaxID=52443 RepID=UPI0025B51E56|nr:metalloregulator ArsR/SmtB family transcription factor [Vibrio tapetis]MDN3680688.1 metalloregulator ArsR/SmtB family transcription factor [Vibrio tapetis subsp. quintayensis]
MELEKMKANATEVAEILKIMSHPDRLMVLCQLVDGEVGAGQLQSQSPLSQSAFSQHLTVLRKHELVKVRKESQQVFYSLADPRVEKLITNLHDVFCS